MRITPVSPKLNWTSTVIFLPTANLREVGGSFSPSWGNDIKAWLMMYDKRPIF
jgi:hypothetical protein